MAELTLHHEVHRGLSNVVERTVELLYVADDDRRPHHGDEEIGGEGEVTTGLADASQISVDEDDDDTDRDRNDVANRGKGTVQCGSAGRTLDGHRDDVVDQQRDGRDLGDLRSEVVARHDVRTTGGRVVLDDVEVRRRDEEEDAQDDEHDRYDESERGETDIGRQLRQDLFSSVRRGRDAVRGQHAERGEPSQSLVTQLFGDVRFSEQYPLQAVPRRLGVHLGQVGVRRQYRSASRYLIVGF